uniref:PR/SET domain 14 n=1 Tax=Amazona collaria TaxID=241587 RepID=A0A8B9FEG2_9PSIT
MLPASPPLPHYSLSRAPTFLSQPPPLPAEPFPGLPLPHYAKPQDPFSPREDSLVRAGAPGSPSPLYLSPPHNAARIPKAGAPEGQSHRYHFTEEELNAVLYGALRSSQLAGSVHAISGPRLYPASPGKGVLRLVRKGLPAVAYGDLSQVGVFCTDPIPKGVRFGPFQGKVVSISEIKIYDDNSLMWEVIFECDRLSHFIDGKGASGNWMSLVNCARYPEEQNLTAIQCEGQIFYESCKEILPKQELLVWYGDCYVQFLGIPISLKDGEEGKKHPEDPEGEPASPSCPWSCVWPGLDSILRTHIRQHSGEKPFKCKHCGKVFASHAAHDSHVRRMHSKEECICSMCGEHFLEQEDYQVHLKMHDAY